MSARNLQRACQFELLLCGVCLAGCSGSGEIANANRMNSMQLMTAAAAELNAGRIENAGFLFLAGQARYQIDRKVFPPVGQGGNSPGVLMGALGASMGQSLQTSLSNDPVAYAKATTRFAQWSPEVGNGYDPGWEYANPLGAQAAAAVVAKVLKPALAAAQAKAKLLQNDEYVRLSQVLTDAGDVERRHSEAMQRGRGTTTKELQEEHRLAIERKNAAAKRLKEIEFELSPETRWHAAAGWKAEDYFDDRAVVELCQAIERNDLAEMKRLISAGANVKAIGKDAMTPLLWAFPDRKLERFAMLLEHGADPNVFFESDFGVANRPFHPYPAGGSFFLDRGSITGMAVTHLAARAQDIGYLRLVLAHGGDANIVDQKNGVTPLDIVADRYFHEDILQRFELLISKGANLDRYCKFKGGTPVVLAVQHDRFAAALLLLESGADPTLYLPIHVDKLIHYVVRKEDRLGDYRPEMVAEYQSLVKWLEEHGESVAEARKEITQWNVQYRGTSGTGRRGAVTNQIISEQKRAGRKEARSSVE